MSWQVDFNADTKEIATTKINALPSSVPNYAKNFLLGAVAAVSEPESGHHLHVTSQGDPGNGDIEAQVQMQ